MELFLNITLGLGLALAVGIRPFLPVLLFGALASGDVAVNLAGTDFSFLEQSGFLLVIVLLLIGGAVAERSFKLSPVEGPLDWYFAALGLILGAVLFSAALAEGGYTWWPGIPAGLVAAGFANYVVRRFMFGVRSRLDPAAANATVIYLEGVAVIVAALAVFLPPSSIVVAAALAWLLRGVYKRNDEKHAGLRVLRR